MRNYSSRTSNINCWRVLAEALWECPLIMRRIFKTEINDISIKGLFSKKK